MNFFCQKQSETKRCNMHKMCRSGINLHCMIREDLKSLITSKYVPYFKKCIHWFIKHWSKVNSITMQECEYLRHNYFISRLSSWCLNNIEIKNGLIKIANLYLGSHKYFFCRMSKKKNTSRNTARMRHVTFSTTLSEYPENNIYVRFIKKDPMQFLRLHASKAVTNGNK